MQSENKTHVSKHSITPLNKESPHRKATRKRRDIYNSSPNTRREGQLPLNISTLFQSLYSKHSTQQASDTQTTSNVQLNDRNIHRYI